MLRKDIAVKIVVVSLFLVSGISQQVQAQPHGPERHPQNCYYTPHYMPHGKQVRELPRGYTRVHNGPFDYYYWEGMFYRLIAKDYVVVYPPVGVVVPVIPQGCQPVVVDGIAYYNINGITYMATPNGYQVVPQPKTIVIKNYINGPDSVANTATQAAAGTQTGPATGEGDSFTVNVPNSQGGYTAVTLKRSKDGFVGPQGEYYAEFPTVEYLKAMYVKK
jgi:hypothetical protein